MAKKTFPAIKTMMGEWDYYSMRVKFSDLRDVFVFSSSLGDPSSLDAVMQREWSEGRSTNDMSRFLISKPDRFYGALVVASLELKDLKWKPIELPKDELAELTKDESNPEEPSEDKLGYVTLSDEDTYYILDGQHRVGSILSVFELAEAPEAFEDEEIMVLLVQADQDVSIEEMRISYRRLFIALNKNAKPTGQEENIIMDENDVYAILTRRLVESFNPFLTTSDKATENENIKIYGNKMNTGDPEFTTLITLYSMNKVLLEINLTTDLNPQEKEDKDIRPDDHDLDYYLKILIQIWEAIFEVFPEFNGDRQVMRSHNYEREDDHVFLWPQMQLGVLAPLVRSLINNAGMENELNFTEILAPLSKLEHDARKAPYRKLWIVPDDITFPDDNLKIQDNTDRTKIPSKILDILRYQLGLDSLNPDKVEILKNQSGNLGQEGGLVNSDLVDEWWEEIEAKKIEIDS